MLRLIAQLLSAKTRDKRMETCIWAKEVLQPNNTNTKLYFYFTTVYLIAQQKSISLKDLDALNEIGAKAILGPVTFIFGVYAAYFPYFPTGISLCKLRV